MTSALRRPGETGVRLNETGGVAPWVHVRGRVDYGSRYRSKGRDQYRDRMYPRRGYVTCVAIGSKEEENERVAAAFEDIFGFRPKVGKYHYARTDVQSVGRWFVERGLIGRARTKRLPEWLYSEILDVRQAFLNGYNAADGHILPKGPGKGRWSHTISNEPLMRDIRHLARGCGHQVSNVSVYHYIAQAPNSPEPTEATNVNTSGTRGIEPSQSSPRRRLGAWRLLDGRGVRHPG